MPVIFSVFLFKNPFFWYIVVLFVADLHLAQQTLRGEPLGTNSCLEESFTGLLNKKEKWDVADNTWANGQMQAYLPSPYPKLSWTMQSRCKRDNRAANMRFGSALEELVRTWNRSHIFACVTCNTHPTFSVVPGSQLIKHVSYDIMTPKWNRQIN